MGHKLNVYKKFRRRIRRALNVLYTFKLRPVSRGRFLQIAGSTNDSRIVLRKSKKTHTTLNTVL